MLGQFPLKRRVILGGFQIIEHLGIGFGNGVHELKRSEKSLQTVRFQKNLEDGLLAEFDHHLEPFRVLELLGRQRFLSFDVGADRCLHLADRRRQLGCFLFNQLALLFAALVEPGQFAAELVGLVGELTGLALQAFLFGRQLFLFGLGRGQGFAGRLGQDRYGLPGEDHPCQG